MKTWQAILAAFALVGGAFGAFFVIDGRYFHVDAAANEKKAIRLELAQSVQSIQADVNGVRLQQMQWELNDILARENAGASLPGDAARKLVLIERIKVMAAK